MILEIADALGGAEARRRGGDVTAVLERATSLADWIAAPAADATPSLAQSPRSVAGAPAGAARALRRAASRLAGGDGGRGGRPKRKRKGGGKKKGGEPSEPSKRGAPRRRRGGVRFSRIPHLEKVRDALAASSRAHPQTHTVWVLLMDAARTHAIPGALEALWETQVERGLMTSGSHQRRFLGSGSSRLCSRARTRRSCPRSSATASAGAC